MEIHSKFDVPEQKDFLKKSFFTYENPHLGEYHRIIGRCAKEGHIFTFTEPYADSMEEFSQFLEGFDQIMRSRLQNKIFLDLGGGTESRMHHFAHRMGASLYVNVDRSMNYLAL